MSQIFHAKDLRPGHTVLYKNNPYLVINNSFNKTAMREGIVKCKMKNLRTGSITVEVLTGMKLEQAPIEKKQVTFSYIDNKNYVFMDNTTYEQIEINEDKLAWEKNFIQDETEISLLSYNGEILGISLPDQIKCVVEKAEEAVQGNTVQTAEKKAWLSTGYEISVPQFVNSGDTIIVRTSDGSYKGRTK